MVGSAKVWRLLYKTYVGKHNYAISPIRVRSATATTYTSINGKIVPLCTSRHRIFLSLEDAQEYIRAKFLRDLIDLVDEQTRFRRRFEIFAEEWELGGVDSNPEREYEKLVDDAQCELKKLRSWRSKL